MELNLTHETICINEVVFDGALEQTLELDYMLPDYCKSIFKVLKCRVVPKITGERIQNSKLIIDGVAQIKVLYVGEENYQIRCIMQKQIFSKSVDLKENYQNAAISSFVKCDYVNCRAVSPHRLDIRGALSIKATISVTKELEILSKATGMGVQICNKNVTTLDKKLIACKEFSISEELELAYGKPSIGEILDSYACATLSEYKIIANKIIAKGEITLHTLYCPHDENESPQIMDFTVPVSQVVDMPGINEDYRCIQNLEVTSTELNLRQNSEGECKCIDAEFCLRIRCEGDKNAQAHLISDVYSTDYKVTPGISKLKTEELIDVVQETSICKATVTMPQSEISCVYDISCDYQNGEKHIEDNIITLSGCLLISVLALDCDNMPIMVEKNSPCEIKINILKPCEKPVFSPNVLVSSVSYRLLSATELEVSCTVKVCGSLFCSRCYDVLTSITVDETAKKECCDNAVLRLYFAQKGEMIWDIAKRFNTSPDAVMSQNKLEDQSLASKGMLLIPITKNGR